ncbi:hypothetical protein KJ359_002458 [Pestalotiopsis sp. 9143b]|nr:hypothetical protein KJ359_002458 [Pestalotiopsis sp. 9143b]
MDGWETCKEVKDGDRVHPTSKRTDLPRCEEEWPPRTHMRTCRKCKNEPLHNWPITVEPNQDSSDPGDANLKTGLEQWLGGTNVLLGGFKEDARKQAEMVAKRKEKIAAAKKDASLPASNSQPPKISTSLPSSNSQPPKMSTMGGQKGGCGYQEGQESLMPPVNTGFNLNGPNQLANRPVQTHVPLMTATQKPRSAFLGSSGLFNVQGEGLMDFESIQPGLPTQPATGIYQPAPTAEAVPGRVIPSIEVDDDMDLGPVQQSNIHVNGAESSGNSNGVNTGHIENDRQSEALRLPRPTIGPSCDVLSRHTGVPDFEAIQRSFDPAFGPRLESDRYEYSYAFVPTTVPGRVHGAQAGHINREQVTDLRNEAQELAPVEGTLGRQDLPQDVQAVHGTLYRWALPRIVQTVGEPTQNGPIQHIQNAPEHHSAQVAQEAAAMEAALDERFPPESFSAAGVSAQYTTSHFEQNVGVQQQPHEAATAQTAPLQHFHGGDVSTAGIPVRYGAARFEQANMLTPHAFQHNAEARVQQQGLPVQDEVHGNQMMNVDD